jgi:hypothetical protein
MSNLLKSKFLLGLMIVAILFVGVLALQPAKTADAADCTITSTLRLGSKGSQVVCLQSSLGGLTADGVFGKMTQASVKAFQANKGLVADGVFGPISRSALVAGGSISGNFPAGCSSAAGYSSTTGVKCDSLVSNTFAPQGCTSASGYSPVTGGACYAVGSISQTGPVTVALASDTPASGSFLTPAGGVQFAKYAFMGSGTVTSVKLQRVGVSSSATVSNVYLYDGATRLTDGASIGSDNTVTFNSLSGLFTVAGSKTITVVADTLVNDYSLGFTLIGFTANGTASTVNVAGNLLYGAAATLAKITLTSPTGSGATDAGLDVNVWQGTASVDLRDVLLKRLALRNIGSIATADINNFKLYADNVLVATVASLDSNGYVTFDTSYALKTGARILKVTADILGGAGRSVQMSLRGAYDLQSVDTQYNASGITVYGSGFPFGPVSFTVNPGTMTVVKKADSPSTNVTLGASDQVLATYTFTAYGEPVKVETLKVGVFQTGGGAASVSLRNGRILVNGAQVGSNTTIPAEATYLTNTGTQFTTNFMVYPGTPATVEIRADVYDNEGTDEIAAGTVTAIQALLVGGADVNNATPQVSLGSLDVPTATNSAGNNLLISSGAMTLGLTSNYGTQTVVVPATAYKIGSYQLSGNATEAVNLNTIYVGFTAGSTVTEQTDLTDLYVVYGGVMSPVKGSVSSTVLNGNSWSINKVLAKNETIQIDVYASLASTVSTNAIITTMAVAGITANSGIAFYADSANSGGDKIVLDAGFTGQTVNGGTGTIGVSLGSTPNAAIVDDSGTVTSAAFKFDAGNDSYTITAMTVTITDPSAVSTVTLMDGATPVVGGSKSAAASIVFDGLTLLVPANQSKEITVQLVMSGVGSGAGATGGALLTTLTAATARNTAGSSSTPTGLPKAGNPMYVYKAFPTITNVALPTSLLVGGGSINTLAKFTISSNGGVIQWSKLLATVTVGIAAADDAFTLPTLWDVTSGATQVIAAGSFVTGLSNASGSITIIPDAPQQISGSKTYELRATIAGTVAANDIITTQITQPSGFAASVKAFKTNAASGLAYYDKAGNSTAVAATDVRAQATAQYTTADVVAGATAIAHNAAAKISQAYGVSATGTITYTEGATADKLTSATATYDGMTCTLYKAGPAIYTVADAVSTITSMTCTGTGKQLLVTGLTVAGDTGADVDAGTLVFTITKAADYAVGSAVGATNSDVALVVVAGVLPAASLVWSDVSAPSHSILTADWTNGYLVANLPNSTQSLSK